MTDRLRFGLVGTGWITGLHLAALERLDRTELVGVVSASPERAAETTARWGGAAYSTVAAMLDGGRPDAVYVCQAPHRAAAACEALVERGVPFLTEKPLAATAPVAERLGALLEKRNLVVAVGYNWRGLDFLPSLRRRLTERPPRLILGRWTGGLPPPPWWRHVAESGGQVVEQATHLYDIARHLVGEADVVAATSAGAPRPEHPDADVDLVASALLRFHGGPLGAFVNASILPSSQIEIDFLSDGGRATIRMHGGLTGPEWTLTIDDGDEEQTIGNGRDSYEVQAEAFLDAVAARAPDRVLSTYADALRTDRLVRAVVAATGSAG